MVVRYRDPGVAWLAMSSYSQVIAAEIRAEMARQSVTQVRLGTLIGKPQTTVSRWVSGAKPLDVDDLDLIAKALGLTVVDLVSRSWDAMADNRWSLPLSDLSASSQVSGMSQMSA